MAIKVVASINRKGGVGKTTFAGTLGEYLSILMGKRILVAEVDAQMNLTGMYIATEEIPGVGRMPVKNPCYEYLDEEDKQYYNERSTIADIFENPIKDVMPYPTFIDEELFDGCGVLDLIAGNDKALTTLLDRGPEEERENEAPNVYKHLLDVSLTEAVNKIVAFCSLPDIESSYDVLILDCAPSTSVLFRAALRAATHVVVPYIPEEKAVEGVAGMMYSISEAKAKRAKGDFRKDNLELIGFLPSRVEIDTNTHMDFILDVQDAVGDKHFPDDLMLRKWAGEKGVGAYTQSIDRRPSKKSIFLDDTKKAADARKNCEEVCAYVAKQIFGETA